VAELHRFDWVVVEPDNLGARGLEELQRAGVEVFAYLSLGEAAPDTVDPSWILGRNAPWGSVIVDPRAAGRHAQVLARVDALHARGYRGLFLNRGFELMDEIGSRASAVAAESLLFGWDAAGKRYVEVPAAERAWLADKLHEVQDRFDIPIVVIDYLPASRGDDARAAARRIQAMGFVPWIATPALDVLGVGAIRIPLARTLLLYDGAEPHSPVIDLIAERLQGLGCAVDYFDVRRGLPREPDGHRSSIVTWFSDDDLPEALGYPRWLTRQIEAGSRIVIFGRPGFAMSRPVLGRLGLKTAPASAAHAARVVRRDRLISVDPLLRSRGLLRWYAVAPDVDVHLRIEDADGHVIDPVVTAPWGGMALQPYLVEIGYQGHARWIVDPTAMLQLGLGRAGGMEQPCTPDPGGGRE
jgi:hypothetical protein